MAEEERTIGNTGRQYSTIALFEADLDNTEFTSAGTDVIGVLYDDGDFAEPDVTWDGWGTNIASVTLRPADGHKHDGTDAGGGVKLRWDTGGGNQLWVLNDGPLTMEDIDFDCNGNGSGKFMESTGAASLTFKWIRCLYHDFDQSSAQQCQWYKGNSRFPYWYSCIGYNIRQSSGGSAHCSIWAYHNTTIEIHGCTGHDAINDNGSGQARVFQTQSVAAASQINCIGGDASGTTSSSEKNSFHSGNAGSSTCTHNIYTAGTNQPSTTGGQTDTSADLFVNPDSVGGYDLHLNNNSNTALDNGTDLTTDESRYDIDGGDRHDGAVTWDIGADEEELEAPLAGRIMSSLAGGGGLAGEGGLAGQSGGLAG